MPCLPGTAPALVGERRNGMTACPIPHPILGCFGQSDGPIGGTIPKLVTRCEVVNIAVGLL